MMMANLMNMVIYTPVTVTCLKMYTAQARTIRVNRCKFERRKPYWE